MILLAQASLLCPGAHISALLLQGLYFFGAAGLLGREELDIAQINGSDCSSVVIDVADFLSRTGLNILHCDPPTSQARRRLMSQHVRAGADMLGSSMGGVAGSRGARRLLQGGSAGCSAGFQPPGADQAQVHGSSYAGAACPTHWSVSGAQSPEWALSPTWVLHAP